MRAGAIALSILNPFIDFIHRAAPLYLNRLKQLANTPLGCRGENPCHGHMGHLESVAADMPGHFYFDLDHPDLQRAH